MSDAANLAPDGWRATSLLQQPVVDVNGGQTLGEVADLVFDPAASTLAGLLVASRGQNASLLSAARRAFGGTMGLTYIGLDHVLALSGDVVTVELPEKTASPAHGPLPRLNAVLRFDVITIKGKRLGQLADLLLDAEGRRILGFLVASRQAAADVVAKPPLRMTDAAAGDMPEIVSVEPVAVSSVEVPASAPLILVPSDQEVRVGHDLIIVAGTATSNPSERSNGSSTSPFALRSTSRQQNGAPNATEETDEGWQVYEPDAPTEQIHP